MIKIVFSIILLVLSALFGILGTLFKTEKESGKTSLKRPNKIGFAFIFIILATLVFGIGLSLVEYIKTEESLELQETRRKVDSIISDVTIKGLRELRISDSIISGLTIKGLRELRTSDSARIQTDSIMFLISIEKFNEQLNKQNRTLDELVQIARNQEEIKGVQTGGDSYGIIKFILERKNIYENNLSSNFRIVFVHLGDYPLYDVSLFVWDMKNRHPKLDDPNNNIYLGDIYPPKMNNFIKNEGNNNSVYSRIVKSRIINNDENIIYYKIKTDSRNIEVDQTSILLKQPSHGEDIEIWVEATYLSSFSKGGIFDTIIDDGFPRLENGEIPWDYYDIKKAISKNLLVWP